MSDQVKKSIVIRTGMGLIGISLTALLSMFVSMIVGETLEGDAQAINLSGSMRMQSYRMVNARISHAPKEKQQALIKEFETKLHDPLLKHVMSLSDSDALQIAYVSISHHWEQKLKPALLSDETTQIFLLKAVDTFVEDINIFVTALEHSAESKLRLLSILQGVTMFVVVLVSFGLLYKIYDGFVLPLRSLMAAAHRIREGDFSGKIYYSKSDELGVLAHSFNRMSEELSVLYKDLEDRVERKTSQLKQSNESLKLLYESGEKLYSDPSNIHQNLKKILHDLQSITKLNKISIYLSKSSSDPAYDIMTSDESDSPSFCKLPDCDQCRPHPDESSSGEATNTIQFPIGQGDRQRGLISVEQNQKVTLKAWENDLFSALAEMIATTLSLVNQGEQEARLALMEERAVIARELHDSLAQSLSYQKMQAARLKKLIEKNAEEEKIFSAINDVQEGLNSSYRQLRELLGTFRMKIEAPGLEPALIGTVAEFKDRSDLSITLNYKLGHCPLKPNEEIHCLQIIREALSNVVKHAQASESELSLYQENNGEIVLSIIDNGIGIPENPGKANHYGLAILMERTDSLGGTILIERRGPDTRGSDKIGSDITDSATSTAEETGTRVEVRFTPSFIAQTYMDAPQPPKTSDSPSTNISSDQNDTQNHLQDNTQDKVTK